MKKPLHLLLLAAALVPRPQLCLAQAPSEVRENSDGNAFVYEQGAGGKEMKLYVFQPPRETRGKPRGAIVVFHGGGWSEGTAEWTFGQARYFASLGMVGISVDYRLANGKDTTPVEAVEDAKAAIRWVRNHAESLNVDPKRVAAYGESAGGHLAAATAIIGENPSKDDQSAVPDALVLYSPALNVESSEHFQTLVRAGQDVDSILPAKHIRKGMPPTIIVTGALDKMPTPAAMSEFCEKMKQAHNRCELHVYPGVGHMLQTPGESEEKGQGLSKTSYDSYLKIDLFLASLGYIPMEKKN